jgi:hypothetical protein
VAREGADSEGALWVPLNCDNEVLRVKFDGLNDAISWRDRCNSKVVAGFGDGLMMARVHENLRAGRIECGEAGSLRKLDRVGVDDITAGTVIDRSVEYGFEVLNQSAIAPDVECLRSVADGEDRLTEVERVLQEELIDSGTGRISGAALSDSIFIKPLRINIIAATWQQDTMGVCEGVSDAIRWIRKANY